MDSVLPLKYEEIEELVKEKNITEKQYYIWTDFERLNFTHFLISMSSVFYYNVFYYICGFKDSVFPAHGKG